MSYKLVKIIPANTVHNNTADNNTSRHALPYAICWRVRREQQTLVLARQVLCSY